MSRLPPLSAIRAFEAAARHGSFTKAAEELGMTQAAVSYQVKLLEDRVGTPLFLRQPRRVVLSDAGKRLAPAVAEAFQRLNAAFANLRETDESVLSVTAINTFCTNWLVPRLGTFQVAHPNIAVRLDASSRLVDFGQEDFDIGVRAGKGVWPGLKAHMLFRVEFVAVCSPDFLARVGKIESATDLMRLPLLDWADEALWRQWFASAGVSDPLRISGPKISVQTQQMVASAAMAGQGIGLVTPALFAADLAAGRMVQVLPFVSYDNMDYWVIYPEGRQNSPKIRAFRDWIVAEVAKDLPAKERTKPRLAVM